MKPLLKRRQNKTSARRTICEVHRQVYRELLKDAQANAMAIELLEEAYIMAKKMSNKLRQYKHGYDDDWWEKNKLAGDAIDKEE